MYKNMVVLLDGSEVAEVVFDYAQELAGRLQMDIDLLHVCSEEEAVYMPMRRAYMHRMAEELCARAEEIRVKYNPESVAACILARGHVVVGQPADEILTSSTSNTSIGHDGHPRKLGWQRSGIWRRSQHVIILPRFPHLARSCRAPTRSLADPVSGRPMVIPSVIATIGKCCPPRHAILDRRGSIGDLCPPCERGAWVGIPGRMFPLLWPP